MATEKEMNAALNRLHHLSMRYAGAFAELVQGKPVGMLPNNYPGLKEFRDLADLILFTRAEISGLTMLLVAKGVFTKEEFVSQMAEEYDFLAKAKAQQFGIGVNDAGLVYTPNDPKRN